MTSSSPNTPEAELAESGVSSRKVMTAAAWSVPVIAVATAAPHGCGF